MIEQHEKRLDLSTNIEINATQADVEKCKKQLVKLKRERKVMDRKLKSSKKKTSNKENELVQLKIDEAEIRTKIEKERATVESRNIRMPRLRTTYKTPVFLAIKNNKLYAVSDVSHRYSSGKKREYNLSSVTVSYEPKMEVIELRNGKGEYVSSGSLAGEIQKNIALNVNKDKEFLVFAVYPDSYGSFNSVKELFAGRGYEFNWSRMLDDESMRIVPAESLETQ